jgi:hypothetical protein
MWGMKPPTGGMVHPERRTIVTDSRSKGARGELEACEALARIGLECRRTVQYNGRAGLADVVCDAALHIEVKRTEKLNPYRFIDQAIGDARRSGHPPLVIMRSSYRPWLMLCRVDDVVRIAEEIIRARSVRSEVEQGTPVEGQGAP